MSSKLFFLYFLLAMSACGVKGDPVAPQGVVVPSLIENYPDIQTEHPLNDNKKL